MSGKRMFSLVLSIVTLLLATGGASTHAELSAVQASSPEQGFSAVISGAPIGSSFLIARQSVATINPEVAYNSQQQDYLVVWQNDRTANDDIYGQRVSKEGALLGPWIAIAYGTGHENIAPHIAYNSQQNEYLVTWNQEDSSGISSVLGQRISGGGLLVGGPIDIQIGSSLVMFLCNAVAYDSTDDKYLEIHAVYAPGTPITKLAGLAINSDGTYWGLPFEIAQSLTSYGCPDLAYNQLRNEFLVVWDQRTTQLDVMARRVKMTGGADVLGNGFTVSSDVVYDDYSARVAALPRHPDGQYLVFWTRCPYTSCSTGADTQAQLISGHGNLEGGTITFPQVGSYAGGGDVGGCGLSSAYFVTRIELNAMGGDPDPDGRLSARYISVDGGMKPDFILEADQSIHPVVACSHNGDYLVAYEKSTEIWGRLVGNRLYLPVVQR